MSDFWLVRIKKQVSVMLDCFRVQTFASHNAKWILRKVCCWLLTVKVTVSVEGKICTVKKRCLNLLPALINEYDISVIISYSISSSGYLLHL